MIIYVMTLSCFDFLICSNFLLPYLLPLSHVRLRGERHLREENLSNSLHIFIIGYMSISKQSTQYSHSTCHPSLGILVFFISCSVQQMFLCYLTLFTQVHLLQASSIPQGKYMHHTHVHEDLLLSYILFARETHECEGIFLVSI